MPDNEVDKTIPTRHSFRKDKIGDALNIQVLAGGQTTLQGKDAPLPEHLLKTGPNHHVSASIFDSVIFQEYIQKKMGSEDEIAAKYEEIKNRPIQVSPDDDDEEGDDDGIIFSTMTPTEDKAALDASKQTLAGIKEDDKIQLIETTDLLENATEVEIETNDDADELNKMTQNLLMRGDRESILASLERDREELEEFENTKSRDDENLYIVPPRTIFSSVKPKLVRAQETAATAATAARGARCVDTDCNAILPEGALFCSECGKSQKRVAAKLFCSQCGSKIGGNGKFCISCGTAV